MDRALKKWERYFEDFYLYKAEKSENFLCAKIWGNFQAPHKQTFGFCDNSFSFMLQWHLQRYFCDTFTCCHTILKYQEKKKSKYMYKSEGYFSRAKKAPDGLCNFRFINCAAMGRAWFLIYPWFIIFFWL